MTRGRAIFASIRLDRPGRPTLLLRTRIVLLLLAASAALAAIVGAPLAVLWNLSESEFAFQQQSMQQEEWENVVLASADSVLALTAELLAVPQLNQPLPTRADGGVVDPALAAAVRRSGDASLRLVAVLGPDGQLLRSSADPRNTNGLLNSLSLVRGIATTTTKVGLSVERDGRLVLVAAAPLGDARLFIVGLPDRLLDGFSLHPGAMLFLVNLAGKLIDSNAPNDWPLVHATGIRSAQIRTIRHAGQWFTLIATEVDDIAGSPIAMLIAMRDATASIQQRRLVLLNTAAAAVLFFMFSGLLLYGYMRSALAPLGDMSRVVGSLAAGDVVVAAPIGWRRDRADEVGAIGRAVEVFRHNAISLQRHEIRANLQTQLQNALIRREMQGLAETLAEPARGAILADLERIETVVWDGANVDEAADTASGNALALAFRQMVGRVVEQHQELSELLEERTRDLAIVREALAERAQLVRMREELNVARELQLSNLPTKFPAFPDRRDFDICAKIAPAREVGGDFYDFLLLDNNRLALLIGDASGKGVSAALFIARARTLMRSSIGAGASPAAALAFASAALLTDNPSAMFATAFAAILDLRTGSLTYGSAGHNPPYLLRCNARPEPLDQSPGAALGFLDTPDYIDATAEFRSGDRLFLYTDGITEAVAENAGFYGEERLIEALGRGADLTPMQLIGMIETNLAGFVQGTEQADDITMLAIAYYGSDCRAGRDDRPPLAAGRGESGDRPLVVDVGES